MMLGLITGTGDVPRLIAEDRKQRGLSTFLIVVKGFEESWMEQFDHEVCGIAETGKMLKALHRSGCEQITFIGNVKRPDFSKLKPDLKAMSLLPKVLKEATKGDDALLRALIKIFEDDGFEVIGAQDVMEHLKPKVGVLTETRPNEVDIRDIEQAFQIAGEIGRMDIGQGVVLADGLVLAVEAQEGTDQMLNRVARLPEEIRGTEDDRKGVLLKRPKPIQERRIDLPTIGMETIKRASEAGLASIAFVENGALLVNQEKFVELANEFKMSIICLKENGELP